MLLLQGNLYSLLGAMYVCIYGGFKYLYIKFTLTVNKVIATGNGTTLLIRTYYSIKFWDTCSSGVPNLKKFIICYKDQRLWGKVLLQTHAGQSNKPIIFS